jgi:anti-sigma regulatory factor (Ser/Thr protein kinase)
MTAQPGGSRGNGNGSRANVNGGFVHEALLYADTDEYLAGTLSFLRAGLAADEPSLVAVPGANLALIRDGMGATAGQVRFVDMSEAGRNPGRIIPSVLHAFVDQHTPRRVRIIGEPIWPGRSATEYPACVQHEALINDAFAGRSATILCPYDSKGLDPDVIGDAARTHPIMVHGDDRRPSDGYADPGDVVAAFNRPLPEPAGSPPMLTFDVEDLPAVRQFVAHHATRMGLPAERIGDVQLAINELATNSIIHAGGPGVLRVWYDAEGGHVVCEIRDSGRFTDRLAGRIPPSVTSEGGRGLLLVNYLCDLVRVHTGEAQTTIRLYLRVKGRVKPGW